jgi:hypothetical protein
LTNREIDVHVVIGEADDYIERRMIKDALKKIPLEQTKGSPRAGPQPARIGKEVKAIGDYGLSCESELFSANC